MTTKINIRLSKFSHIFLILFLFSTISFFLPLSESCTKLLNYLLFIILIIISNYTLKYKRIIGPKRDCIFIFSVSWVMFSCIPAKIYWDQSIFASLISVLPFTLYGLYLVLRRLNIEKNVLEKAVVNIGKLYIILLIIKFIQPSFPLGAIVDDSMRGSRIMMNGDFFGYFTFFYYLSKFAKHKNRYNIIWLILSTICIIIPMTRQRIILSIVLGLIYLYLNIKGRKRIYLLIFGLICSLWLTRSAAVNNIINATSNQIESTSPHDQIRSIGYYYYLTSFPNIGINFLIGNGVPSYGRSKYGNDAKDFAENTKIHLVDIGIIGIYNYFGVIGIICYLSMILIFIFSKSDPNYTEYKYMLWFVLGSSFFSGVPLMIKQYIFISICAYLLTPEIKRSNYGCKYNHNQLQYSSISN